MSLLAPFVSARRVHKVATTSSVAWTSSFPLLSLSLSRSTFFPASQPSLWQARELVSWRLQLSDSTQRFANFPESLSSRWLQLPSLGKPALSSPLRAHLTGVPPWSPASWPGLSGPSFPLVFVPLASPRHVVARRDPLLLGLRPEMPAVGRAPPPCRHS